MQFTLTVVRPDLAITLSHAGTFWHGGHGIFKVHVVNTGNGPTLRSEPTEVQVSLPSGLVMVQGGKGNFWRCSKQVHYSSCFRRATIYGHGNSTWITVRVKITAWAGTWLTAIAVVSPADLTSADNTSSDTVHVW
jgi:hypothetical protein